MRHDKKENYLLSTWSHPSHSTYTYRCNRVDGDEKRNDDPFLVSDSFTVVSNRATEDI